MTRSTASSSPHSILTQNIRDLAAFVTCCLTSSRTYKRSRRVCSQKTLDTEHVYVKKNTHLQTVRQGGAEGLLTQNVLVALCQRVSENGDMVGVRGADDESVHVGHIEEEAVIAHIGYRFPPSSFLFSFQ